MQYGKRFKSLAKAVYIDDLDNSCMLIDIRNADEVAAARIKGVPNIKEISAILNLANDNADKKIVLHCKIGGRAAFMGSELVRLGAQNVYFFDDSFARFYDKFEIVGIESDCLRYCE